MARTTWKRATKPPSTRLRGFSFFVAFFLLILGLNIVNHESLKKQFQIGRDKLLAPTDFEDRKGQKEEEKHDDNIKDKGEEKSNKYLASNTVGSSKNEKWWDSSKSVVIGLASGYRLSVYQQFVGSLRYTGYKGHIILGVAENPPSDIKDYLNEMKVTMKEVRVTKNCTYAGYLQENGNPSKDQVCSYEYPDYKIQWGRFPMSRDWLLECEECTDGVMLTDTRDAYFQSDPFSYPFSDDGILPGDLLVFEEIYPNLTANHWLTNIPVKKCRKMEFEGQPMLCSGSTMGTRQGILDYIDSMVKEFDYWKEHQECRSDMVGDDQSIHNYLYYTNQLKNAVSIPHRTGPIHVVGVQADKIFRAAIQQAVAEGFGKDKYEAESFVNKFGYVHWNESNTLQIKPHEHRHDWRTWLQAEHKLIDPTTGLILNHDGKPSPQVHQFDRFGLYVLSEEFLTKLVQGK